MGGGWLWVGGGRSPRALQQQGLRMDQSITSISRLDSTGAESDRLASSDDAPPDDENIRRDSNQIPSCLIKVNVTNSTLEEEGVKGVGEERVGEVRRENTCTR